MNAPYSIWARPESFSLHYAPDPFIGAAHTPMRDENTPKHHWMIMERDGMLPDAPVTDGERVVLDILAACLVGDEGY